MKFILGFGNGMNGPREKELKTARKGVKEEGPYVVSRMIMN